MWRLKASKGRPLAIGEMNSVEGRFHNEVVLPLRHDGKLLRDHHEAFNLRLAPKTYYRPDFALIFRDGLFVFVECKAVWSTGKAGYTDDARVKIKVAASLYPDFAFVSAAHGKKTGWLYECFNVGDEEWLNHLS